jgi:ubiquinone/menaquinone biosynthesis C-methylase UbiE
MIEFTCPRCKAALETVAPDSVRCLRDGLIFQCVDGIWRFLLLERESHFAPFISDYETVRRFEGRGSRDAAFYRSLPFKDLSGCFPFDWAIRAHSYRALESLLHSHFSQPQLIVDLGAGNGWLSGRLSAQGNKVAAVDLLVNPEDGLGAWRNYTSEFTPVQAEFARLPIHYSTASIAIFNASFHYSENYEETLAEALRVLKPGGWIVVMDSPVYHDPESGRQMVSERKAQFLNRYHFASDSLQSENYITYDRMNELGEKLGIRWRHIRPFYGIRWAIRPWLARLRRHREPAEFGLWVGESRQ